MPKIQPPSPDPAPPAPTYGRNISPLGALEVLALGRVVEAGEVVEMTAEQLATLISQGLFEASEPPAEPQEEE